MHKAALLREYSQFALQREISQLEKQIEVLAAAHAPQQQATFGSASEDAKQEAEGNCKQEGHDKQGTD